MPQIPIKFNGGIQFPAKLGTVILKPTTEGKLSYAQNIDTSVDEYGNGILLPGPTLVAVTGNSELTGVPIAKAAYIISTSSVGWIYFAEGALGSTATVRRIKDVEPTETPSIDTTGSIAVDHTSHTGEVVTDIAYRPLADGTANGYIVGKDATDGWIQHFLASAASPSLTVTSTLASFNVARTPKCFPASDGNLYVAHSWLVDKVDSANSYSANVLDIPRQYGVTEMGEWNQNLVLAYNTDFAYTITQRQGGGRSGLIIWDMISASFTRDIPCNSRYISAIVNDPDGSMLAFGGLDEGKTTIYQFNGYSLLPIFSYIGDLPRSRHSVDFDGQGRVIWQTVEGQICRFDKRAGIFEHLGSITTGSSAGGILTRLVGGTGNEFFAASGTGSTYSGKRITFGTYIGDGGGASDTINTPLAISGMMALPPHSSLNSITVSLQKALVSGEKLVVRLYKNGSSTPSTIGSLDYSVDGGIQGKTIYLRKYGIDNMAIGFAWKMADAVGTAPGVVGAVLDYTPLRQ